MKYIFDFKELTALDTAKLASGDMWKIAEVIDKSVSGGLISYNHEELKDICMEFETQYRATFCNPLFDVIRKEMAGSYK